MIDPVKMTRYGLKDVDLQEVLLFCIAVSGKTATTTARLLDEFLRCLHSTYQGDHFAIIREASRTFDLAKFMGQIGFGCYQMKSRGFIAAAHAGLNLKKCTAEELEQIPGIGHKTSNFFLLHTRRGYQGACLDTHILKFLKELGYDVPKVAPQSQKLIEGWSNISWRKRRRNR